MIEMNFNSCRLRGVRRLTGQGGDVVVEVGRCVHGLTSLEVILNK